MCASVRENGRKKREQEKESMISVHKKVDDMEITVIVCYIYLLNVFWGFGSFTVVDIPYNKNIIYLFIVFGPPWTRKHRHVPRMPVHKSGPGNH